MFSNILQIRNTLKGRFSFEYNVYGDLEFKNYIYFLEEEINRLNVELNNNTRVNDNEPIQSGTLSKLFLMIYNLQVIMLELTQPKISNFRSNTTKQNVLMID